MDSIANWNNQARTRMRQTSPLWSNSGAETKFDQGLDFTDIGFSALRNYGCVPHGSELNGTSTQSQLMNLMSSFNSIKGTTASKPPSDGEFGHWRPVYDDKAKPSFSLTGTEIWAVNNKAGCAQNPQDVDTSSGVSKDEVSAFGKAGISESMNNGYPVSRSVYSSGDADTRSQHLNLASGISSNSGWGRTPVCQDKPWDLHQDRAVLESGAVLSCHGLDQDDLGQDCPLDMLKNIISSGDAFDALGEKDARLFDRRLQDGVQKSSSPEDLRTLLDLQKFGPVVTDEMNRSRRGSSVSSIDGMQWTGLVEKKDYGCEPQTNVQMWMERQAMPLKNDWNQGQAADELRSGLQSPRGWGKLTGVEKIPSVDNGTSVWGKQPFQEKNEWSAFMKSASNFPPSVASPFNIDVSIPPPPLSSHAILPPSVLPSPPIANVASFLENLPSSNGQVGRKLSAPQAHVLQRDHGSLSADYNKNAWLLQQQHLGQKSWAGNQWANTDPWIGLQRRGTSVTQNRMPQTRSRLIQELVSAGFKKEDAQTALINHNMDLEKALAELVAKHRLTMAQPAASLHHMGQLQRNAITGKNDTRQLSTLQDIIGPYLSGPTSAIRSVLKDTGSVAASVDLQNKMSSGPTHWETLLKATSNHPIQMVPSAANRPVRPAVSPLPLENAHQALSGLFPSVALSHNEAMATADQDDFRQLSQLMLKKLAENGQTVSQVDGELLQLFAQQLAMTDPSSSQPKWNSEGSIYRQDSCLQSNNGVGSSENGGMADKLNVKQSNVFSKPPILGSGSGLLSAAVSETNDIYAQKGMSFDGHGMAPPFLSRQLSLNFPLSSDDAMSSCKSSNAFSSLQTSPVIAASSQCELPSKLEIKEFIPGIPWRGGHTVAQEQSREDFKDPQGVSPDVAFKSMVDEFCNDDYSDVQDESVEKSLPSKWIQLKNVSDKLDDDALRNICSNYGEAKIFRESNNSLLLSYPNLDDAIQAQAALNQCDLEGLRVQAEFVKDWMSADSGAVDGNEAVASAEQPESVGYVTPGGLWIPPDAGSVVNYYDDADEWCAGFEEGQWPDNAAFDVSESAAKDSTS